MLEFILDLIYPNVCGFCGKINKDCFCEECEKQIKPMLLCNIDKYKDKFYSEHLYLFKYQGQIRNYILNYKFNDKSYIYRTFSKIFSKNEKVCRFFEKYDIIIPVPIHNKRMNLRGYNQSELIAREISKNFINIKLENDILLKIKNTNPQSTLSREERIINSKHVYEIRNKEKIKMKNIILLDDIYTTGSTADECSKILKLSGANNIGIITLAKD